MRVWGHRQAGSLCPERLSTSDPGSGARLIAADCRCQVPDEACLVARVGDHRRCAPHSMWDATTSPRPSMAAHMHACCPTDCTGAPAGFACVLVPRPVVSLHWYSTPNGPTAAVCTHRGVVRTITHCAFARLTPPRSPPRCSCHASKRECAKAQGHTPSTASARTSPAGHGAASMNARAASLPATAAPSRYDANPGAAV